MGEFDLIDRYFKRANAAHSGVGVAIGDDCAVVDVPASWQLAITTDTLVEGTHFLADISPADLAYKAVAVNLSDLAAMGATPKWISLALTLPKVDAEWLNAFSASLFAILARYQVALIGGDTTKGNLSITITAQGLLPKGKGLFRHKAKVGDWLYVSGFLGDSAAGLDLLLNGKNRTTCYSATENYLLERHLRPTPRLELGQLLRDYAHCAIDISDGLLADLSHILKRSQCGAEIWLQNLPISAPLASLYPNQAEQFALTGGENYELCFTLPNERKAAFEQAIEAQNLPCFCIGKITASGLILTKNGKNVPLPAQAGFDHFQ